MKADAAEGEAAAESGLLCSEHTDAAPSEWAGPWRPQAAAGDTSSELVSRSVTAESNTVGSPTSEARENLKLRVVSLDYSLLAEFFLFPISAIAATVICPFCPIATCRSRMD